MNQWVCSWCTLNLKKTCNSVCYRQTQWTVLVASELPFSFHLAAKGKCPPEGLQAQNTANWLTSEPTFAYLLLLHICSQLARSKVCQFSAGKLLLNLLAYSIIIIFSSKCMSGRSARQQQGLQNYLLWKNTFCKQGACNTATLHHFILARQLSYLYVCSTTMYYNTVLPTYVFPLIILFYGPIFISQSVAEEVFELLLGSQKISIRWQSSTVREVAVIKSSLLPRHISV